MTAPPSPDGSLRGELLRMRDADLELRAELARDGSLFEGYAERMAALHRRNALRLREVLSSRGWPGRSLAGEDGAEAAWLVLQHAIGDPELLRGALPLLERAVEAGEAEPRHLAMLVDRVRTLEGGPQLYGTQHDWDDAGELSPLPVEEPAGVDERRRRVGLEPLAESTRRLRARAAAEGETPPADPAARRREAEAWARSIGWRR